MPSQDRFELRFAPEGVGHLLAIDRKYHRLIREELLESSPFSPGVARRNRKMLIQPAPFKATWEFRFGPNIQFRAFYEIDFAEKTVWVLAIGVKDGNRLMIGREEFSP